ncbi:WcbI family polysaccharide biosynthesis putative acetyltransferase [Alphaproteobacteria bacterium]|nr:WcbI family polysaccharide biosynthesis putative acetyltransferase [Alphaproteobacteria bacterium]
MEKQKKYKRLFVYGNCQSAGLSASFRLMLPNRIKVYPLIKSKHNLDEINFQTDDFLLMMTTGAKADKQYLKNLNCDWKFCPIINFNGFHPDICYINGFKSNPGYNSAIVSQCYKNGLSVDDTIKMFNQDTFSKLQYFDQYEVSKHLLRNLFLELSFTDSEFTKFFRKIQQHGIFMHTSNHPMIFVLKEMANILIERENFLNVKNVNLELDFHSLQDTLTTNVWPIYPELANQFCISGSYTWKYGNRKINGLKNFINFSFQKFQKFRISPEEMEITNVSKHHKSLLLNL